MVSKIGSALQWSDDFVAFGLSAHFADCVGWSAEPFGELERIAGRGAGGLG